LAWRLTRAGGDTGGGCGPGPSARWRSRRPLRRSARAIRRRFRRGSSTISHAASRLSAGGRTSRFPRGRAAYEERLLRRRPGRRRNAGGRPRGRNLRWCWLATSPGPRFRAPVVDGWKAARRPGNAPLEARVRARSAERRTDARAAIQTARRESPGRRLPKPAYATGTATATGLASLWGIGLAYDLFLPSSGRREAPVVKRTMPSLLLSSVWRAAIATHGRDDGGPSSASAALMAGGRSTEQGSGLPSLGGL